MAVAAGNRLTILRKEDDYQEPFGTFTGKTRFTFQFHEFSVSETMADIYSLKLCLPLLQTLYIVFEEEI